MSFSPPSAVDGVTPIDPVGSINDALELEELLKEIYDRQGEDYMDHRHWLVDTSKKCLEGCHQAMETSSIGSLIPDSYYNGKAIRYPRDSVGMLSTFGWDAIPESFTEPFKTV